MWCRPYPHRTRIFDGPEHPPTGVRQQFFDEEGTPTTWGGRSTVREGEQFHIRDVKVSNPTNVGESGTPKRS